MSRAQHVQNIEDVFNLPIPSRKFQLHWLQNPLFLGWLQGVGNAGEERSYCTVCSVVLANRIDSLRIHANAFHLNNPLNDASNVIPDPINNHPANIIREDIPAIDVDVANGSKEGELDESHGSQLEEDHDERPVRRRKRQSNNIEELLNTPSLAKKFCYRWLENPIFSGWLEAVGPIGEERCWCKLCSVSVDNRIDALRIHAKAFHELDPAVHMDEAEIPFDDKVKSLEIKLCLFIVQNSIPIEIIENLVSFVKVKDLEPTVVSKIKLKSTKCTQIIKNVLAVEETEKLVNILKTTKFSVLLDESTDITDKKQLSINTHYRCLNTGYTKVQLLDILQLNPLAGTGKEIFAAFEELIDSHEIPWENLVAYSTDNASVFTGQKNSFYTALLTRAPHVILLPCICHSSALACKATFKDMSDDIMILIRGLYTYTSGSSKRLADFQNYQIDHNGGIHKILQMSGTRWLELYYCIDRILNYRESVIAYFKKEYDNFIRSLGKKEATGNTNVEKLIKILEDVNIWPFLYFKKHLLNHFNEFN